MSRHVYGVFSTKDDAAAAYEELGACRGPERCSVVVHEQFADATTDARDTRRGAFEGAAIVGAAGAVITGFVAVGTGMLVVGPLMLAAAAVGGVYGALSGSLSGLADEHADRIEKLLREGKIIVAAEADGPEEIARVEGVLRRHNGVATT